MTGDPEGKREHLPPQPQGQTGREGERFSSERYIFCLVQKNPQTHASKHTS